MSKCSMLIWCATKLIIVASIMNVVTSKYAGAYFQSEAFIVPEMKNINASLITHLYYAFVVVNIDGSLTVEMEDKGYVSKLTELKATNPDLKLLFSCIQANGSLSIVIADENLRRNLIENAVNLINNYDYDGLDFDWEFPVESDKDNFTLLLKETKEEFEKSGYLLTAAVRAIPVYNNSGYNVKEISRYLDIINVMTYDYYGAWSSETGCNSPLFPHHLDSAYEKKYLNVDASIKNWIEAGAPKTKIALGIPFYGRTFTLVDPQQHGIHAPSKGGGTPPALTYRQIIRDYTDYTTTWNAEQGGPYKYKNTTWLSYDNERSVALKTKYAVQNELKGVFVWHLAADDVMGEFSSQKQPLMTVINDNLV